MPKRTTKSQSKHDRKVSELAKEYEAMGYSVSADIAGYPKPKTIGGYRPDVVATKGVRRIIIEVETEDSVNNARDLLQQIAFGRAAKRSKNTKFKRIVV